MNEIRVTVRSLEFGIAEFITESESVLLVNLEAYFLLKYHGKYKDKIIII